jgi:hypothetical protein
MSISKPWRPVNRSARRRSWLRSVRVAESQFVGDPRHASLARGDHGVRC